MVLLRSTRIAQARILSTTSSSGRVLHSSASLGRGIAIGGGVSPSTQHSSPSNVGGGGGGGGGSPFAALRRQAKAGKQETLINDVEKPETSSRAAQSETHKQATRAAKTPNSSASSSAQARKKATIQQSHQVDRTRQPNTLHVAKEEHVGHGQAADWAALSRRIETAQKEEALEGGAARQSRRLPYSNAGAGAIESLPQWSVSDASGVQRSFAFHDQVGSRMFLQGVSSTLMLHNGWVGHVSLNRTSQGSERVVVSFGGSRDVDESYSESSDVSVTEQDIALAESIDTLYGDVTTTKKQPNARRHSLAFAEETVTRNHASSQSSSVLEVEQSLSSEPIDEHVPFYVHKAEEEPTMSALGSTTSRTSASPIEEYVPVPNLHQQPRREFATLMGRQPYATRGSGLTSIVTSQAAAAALMGRSSSARHRRKLTTWSSTNATVQASLHAWSELVGRSQIQKALRIDDFLPVHIDASQVGPRRTVTG